MGKIVNNYEITFAVNVSRCLDADILIPVDDELHLH